MNVLDPLPIPNVKPIRADLETPTDQEEIFAAELGRLGVEYNYATKAYTVPGAEGIRRKVLPDSLFDRLVVRGALQLGADTSLTHELLARYLRLWRENEEAKEVQKIRDKIKTVDRDKGQAELHKWLDIVCREGHELSQVIMTQWVWLVRCKLFAPELADSHVMPVLQGAQGAGKSKAVRRLLAPLYPLTTTWTFDQICDDRNWLELPRRYVGYVEELAGANKEHLGMLKGLITAQTRDVRLFRTQDRTEVAQNCTFIGDTNSQVRDIIKDDTGGRRFWEIRCKDIIPEENLDDIDYYAIWGCVSEQDPCPTQSSEHFGTIKELQSSKIRHRSSVDEWLLDQGITPGDTLTPIKDLYKSYCDYCTEGREYALSLTKWSREMTPRGFERTVMRCKKYGRTKAIGVA